MHSRVIYLVIFSYVSYQYSVLFSMFSNTCSCKQFRFFFFLFSVEFSFHYSFLLLLILYMMVLLLVAVYLVVPLFEYKLGVEFSSVLCNFI